MQHTYKDGELLTASNLNSSFEELETTVTHLQNNEINIAGTWYKRSGIQEMPQMEGTWYTWRDPIYMKDFSIAAPYTPPKGYGFMYSIAQQDSFCWVENATSIPDSENKIGVRLVSLFSDNKNTVRLLHWHLVKLEK